MSVMYRLMYAVGFTPWDRVTPSELKAVIEGPNALPAGRALDLGSGDERVRYAEGVSALAAPGASMYMMEFTRAVPPVPSGVSDSELRERFGFAWDLLYSRPSDTGTPAMMRATAAWFCLKKR